MAEMLIYTLLSMILSFDGSIGQLQARLKQLGLTDEFNQLVNQITSDTEYLNYLIPDLTEQRQEILEQKLKSSPFGSRIAVLTKQANRLKKDISDRRGELRNKTIEVQNATNKYNRDMAAAESSGSYIIDQYGRITGVQSDNQPKPTPEIPKPNQPEAKPVSVPKIKANS